jgi:hypothetical protein
MQFLGIALFFIVATGFILFGAMYIKTKKSSLTIRNDGKKKRLIYAGNLAIFHGLLYVLIGIMGYIWGLRLIFGYTEISWAWCFTGFGIMWGMVVLGAMILTIWLRILGLNDEKKKNN